MVFKATKDYDDISTSIQKNFKKYFLFLLIFFVGIIIGGIYFNVIKNNPDIIKDLDKLIQENIESILNLTFNEFNDMFYDDLKNLLFLVLASSSIIGIPIIFAYEFYKGITLSITVASIIYTYGLINGNIISIFLLYIPNLIWLSVALILSTSSLKLIRNLSKNDKTLKIEIIRHLIMCILTIFIVFLGEFLRILLIKSLSKVLIL